MPAEFLRRPSLITLTQRSTIRRSLLSLALPTLLTLAAACSGASRPRSAAPLDWGPADASDPPDASRDASEATGRGARPNAEVSRRQREHRAASSTSPAPRRP
jgi:hypothetical protein